MGERLDSRRKERFIRNVETNPRQYLLQATGMVVILGGHPRRGLLGCEMH